MGNSEQLPDVNTKNTNNGLDDSNKNTSLTLKVPLEKGVISRIIRALRNLRNYSQTRLGRILGVQKTQISKLEKGESNITIGTLLKVFTALKTNISFTIKVDTKKDLEVLKEVVNEKE